MLEHFELKVQSFEVESEVRAGSREDRGPPDMGADNIISLFDASAADRFFRSPRS